MKKYFAILILTALIAGLAACSIVDGNRYEYFGYGGSVYDAKRYSGEQPTAKEIPTKKQRDWKNPLAESSSKEAVPQDADPDAKSYVVDNYYLYDDYQYVPVIIPWWSRYNYWGYPSSRFYFSVNYSGFRYYPWYSPWYDYNPFYGYYWNDYPYYGYNSWYYQPYYSYHNYYHDQGRIHWDYSYNNTDSYRSFGPNRGTYGELPENAKVTDSEPYYRRSYTNTRTPDSPGMTGGGTIKQDNSYLRSNTNYNPNQRKNVNSEATKNYRKDFNAGRNNGAVNKRSNSREEYRRSSDNSPRESRENSNSNNNNSSNNNNNVPSSDNNSRPSYTPAPSSGNSGNSGNSGSGSGGSGNQRENTNTRRK